MPGLQPVPRPVDQPLLGFKMVRERVQKCAKIVCSKVTKKCPKSKQKCVQMWEKKGQIKRAKNVRNGLKSVQKSL